MKVPPGMAEYEASVRDSKNLLNRLKKGSKMMDENIKNNQVLEAQRIIRHWQKLSEQLFTQLEMATILHQQMLSGYSVVIRADGTLAKVEDIVDTSITELDAWTLLSMEKLKYVFGDDIKSFINIQ